MNDSFVRLLQLLSDGQFHSGSAIGQLLGISRTAVWKHLQKLSNQGISIESVKGKGYRLVGGLQLLDELVIRKELSNETVSELADIDVLMSTNSTNDMAMNYTFSEFSAKRGYVCLAEYQHAGRGRRGRNWVSPFGHNIYMSLGWQFEEGIARLEGLSLAVGVIVAETLEKLGMPDLQLKWPNDILWQGRKIGGILLEMSGDPAGVCKMVVGIGLNVRMPAEVDIDQPWAFIEESISPVARNLLAAQLISHLVEMVSQYHGSGFAAYKDRWESYDAYRNKSVEVISGDNRQQGVARGVLDNGALRLQVGESEQVVYGGEVSVRLQNAS